MNVLNIFNQKGKKGKQGGINLSSSDLTSILLVVIVVLVIYFIFLDDRKSRKNNKYVDVDVDASIGLNDNTRLGVDGNLEVDNDSIDAQGGLRVGGQNDRVFADASVDYGTRVGASAGLGYGDDLYGVELGYNSDANSPYLNLGELEGFDNHNGNNSGNGNNSDKVNVNGKESAVVLFYADWCGHCRNFKPTWSQFKRVMNPRNNVLVTEVSADDTAVNKYYNITGYPTVKLLDSDGNEKAEFKGERTISSLTDFVNENN